jgi:hypothetical protein
MVQKMVLPTKPVDIERSAVIVMVHLHVGAAAAGMLAWLGNQQPATLVNPRISPRIVLRPSDRVVGKMLAFPCCFAAQTITLSRHRRLRAPATFPAAGSLISAASNRVSFSDAAQRVFHMKHYVPETTQESDS